MSLAADVLEPNISPSFLVRDVPLVQSTELSYPAPYEREKASWQRMKQKKARQQPSANWQQCRLAEHRRQNLQQIKVGRKTGGKNPEKESPGTMKWPPARTWPLQDPLCLWVSVGCRMWAAVWSCCYELFHTPVNSTQACPDSTLSPPPPPPQILAMLGTLVHVWEASHLSLLL